MKYPNISWNTTSAFTLVELIVAASILAILTTIWFYNYTGNIASARDSVRQTDISKLSSELKLYKRQRWAYPMPWDNFEIRNGTGAVNAYQWRMNNNVSLTTADSLPRDPELDIPYFYSVTRNKQEYQLAASIENDGNPYAYLVWDYKSVAKNVLPNIMIASNATVPIDITTTSNQRLFIFHKWIHNLPYDFETGEAFSDGTDLSDLLLAASDTFWQNSDYRSCVEINTTWKNITLTGSTDTYQILNSSWVLVDETCDGIL